MKSIVFRDGDRARIELVPNPKHGLWVLLMQYRFSSGLPDVFQEEFFNDYGGPLTLICEWLQYSIRRFFGDGPGSVYASKFIESWASESAGAMETAPLGKTTSIYVNPSYENSFWKSKTSKELSHTLTIEDLTKYSYILPKTFSISVPDTTPSIADKVCRLWPQTKTHRTFCPVGNCSKSNPEINPISVYWLVIHLNDSHRWSFGAIAEWLDSLAEKEGFDLTAKGVIVDGDGHVVRAD